MKRIHLPKERLKKLDKMIAAHIQATKPKKNSGYETLYQRAMRTRSAPVATQQQTSTAVREIFNNIADTYRYLGSNYSITLTEGTSFAGYDIKVFDSRINRIATKRISYTSTQILNQNLESFFVNTIDDLINQLGNENG